MESVQVAGHLVDFALGAGVDHDGEIGMGVNVNETRRYDQPIGSDALFHINSNKVADNGDLAIADSYIGAGKLAFRRRQSRPHL